MSFQFRFESLLQLRRRQRDEVGLKVGQANEAIAKVDQQIIEVEQQREELRQQTQLSRVGQISVEGLLSEGRFDVQLEADLHGLHETLVKLQAEHQRRQQALAAAEAEVKRFERLKEKDMAQYQQQQLRQQQNAADEATTQKYILQLQGRRNDLETR